MGELSSSKIGSSQQAMTSRPTNVGLRLFARRPPPDPEALAALAKHDVAHLADAMHGFGVVDPAIRPVADPTRRVVGPALTIKVHPGDHSVFRKGMGIMEPGDVVVVDSRSEVTKAVLGGFSTEEMSRRGVEGLIVDGAVRDRRHIERLKVPVFARALHSSPPTSAGPGEINVPVSCGGVVVEPGDIVVADSEGIVVVPARDINSVLDAVAEVAATEAGWAEAIEAGSGILDLAETEQSLDQLGFVTHDVSWEDW